ncbi:MAG: class C sortase [Eubacteriales bacterium]|uniref:class C sortase n=1 Tax=Fenollaria sp. TaxID=1965292 RepID=UPI002A752403|nr:class C sortase [Fenollaria sp.]MDD7339594.1 class C sortase [Eubacteriales bacterium]MDY3105428.1 class C sortase [Fenollaria sp.]
MKNNLFIVLGIVLILFSAIYFVSIKHSQEIKREDALKVEKEFQDIIEEDESAVIEEEKDDKSEDDTEPVADEIHSEKAVAVIRIDKLKLLAQVFDNTDRATLYEGVGIIETTDLPSSQLGTTCALAGHRGGVNEDLSFLNIDQLVDGDEIKVTTKYEVLVYKVTGSEVIEPDDWSKFTRDEDKSRLILMACHPYPKNDKRILIYTELEKSEK